MNVFIYSFTVRVVVDGQFYECPITETRAPSIAKANYYVQKKIERRINRLKKYHV